MSAIVVGCVAVALILGGSWFGSTLVKSRQVGWGVTVFLIAAICAGVATDNIR